jgi:protein-S-isoprenylcysteine O-methyltransferase Ste14
MTPRYRFSKPYADRVARWRVPAGFVLAAAFAWFSAPTRASLAWGAGIAGAGMLLRAWAAGHLAKNQRLATTGPYAWTRNPLYLGTLLAAAGFAIAGRSVGLAVLFAAVFALVYLPAIELEEQHLRALFPEYAAYAQRVPRLAPRPPRRREGRFRLSLYLQNQEYQALAGYLAGLLFLYWKAV